MLPKTLLVVLLAVQYHFVDGSERNICVSELITNYCPGGSSESITKDSQNNDSQSNSDSYCKDEEEHKSFDAALAHLTSDAVINITTDSTLIFYNKMIRGLRNVSIIGYNNPTVYCYNNTIVIGGLQFDSCNNFTIRGITWSGCGGIFNNEYYPAIEFYNSSNITIQNCTFQYSKGQAVVISKMAGNVNISHCKFLHNRYNGRHGGAAIHIASPENSPVNLGYCNFTDNEGSNSIVHIEQSNDELLHSFNNLCFYKNKGVAIYLNHQNLFMFGDFIFKENVAENGAGMFIYNYSNVYFDKDSSVEFLQNRATNSGGAIILSMNSTISLGQKSEFINNQADKGGAIALYNYSSIKCSLDFSVCNDAKLNGEVLFVNNNGISSGGAIFLNSHSAIAFKQNFTFTNNTANDGGAIAMHNNCQITIKEYSMVNFTGNTAQQSGGALHLSTYCKISFKENCKVLFKQNVAMDYGMAMFSEINSNISFEGNSSVIFCENNFPSNGTLYSKSASLVMEHSNVTFNGNSAQWHYGNEYTEGNDIIISADGIVKCSDYIEYYICSNNTCSCDDIRNVANDSVVTITNDLKISLMITLENLNNITLVGHNNSTIHYQSDGELKFKSCQNLEIKEITWNRTQIKSLTRLSFIDAYNVMVRNCFFQYSNGRAILLSNVSGNVSISHCKFIHDNSPMHGIAIYYKTDHSSNTNQLIISNCHFNYTKSALSLIYLNTSKNTSDHIVVKDSVFFNNRGACIYGFNQNLSMEGNVLFDNNEAESGAGIFMTSNSNIMFRNNSNVEFVQNTAYTNGGAIYLSDHSGISFQSNSNLTFSNNKAKSGGAIYSTYSNIMLEDNSDVELSENEAPQGGGAIYSETYSKITFKGKCTIFNSRVYSGDGGAIYSSGSNINFMGSSTVTFDGNEVFNGFGGAIYLSNENAQFNEMSNINFTNNKATDGGALYFRNSNAEFKVNSHVSFFRNEAINFGGSIYFYENDISFEDNSTVQFNNSNAKSGGALYATNCSITNEGNSRVEFNHNKAGEGGAIYLEENSNLSIMDSSEVMFLENKVTGNGGAIYFDLSDITFSSNSSTHLNSNVAAQGGAIYSNSDSSVIFKSNVTFTENEASRHGGSMYLQSDSNIIFEGSCMVKYDKNTALNGNGGAIYCTGNSATTFQGMSKIIFNANKAIDGGALHHVESQVQLENYSSVIFSNNEATSGGAINFQVSSSGIFGGNATFLFCNNKATSGGAIYLENNVTLSFEKVTFNTKTASSENATKYCNETYGDIFTNTSNIFYKNNAEVGGAAFLTESSITFDSFSSITFNSNEATQDGGAIYLGDNSTLTFNNNSTVNFSNNNASDYGGAIYGKFSTTMRPSEIYFSSTNITFQKNNARIVGNSIYINLPIDCNGKCLNDSILDENDNFVNHIMTSPNQLKLYHPAKCIYGSNSEECKLYYINNIMLGQEILLDACMYDYYDQKVNPAQFMVSSSDENYTLGLNATFISCNHTVPGISINGKKKFSELPYNYSMDITLFVNRISASKRVSVTLTVELRSCHQGFRYHDRQCTCYTANDIVFCSGSSSFIKRGYWFGIIYGKPTGAFCPINYCNFSCCETSNGYYDLSPTRDNQCRSHRTNIACGDCEQGYTLSYDSAKCISVDECTTEKIALVVTLTVLYWIVLFVIIFVMMQFKIEIGYLYGLTYYYSIIDIVLSQNLHFSDGFFTTVTIMSSFAKVTPQFLGQLCLFKDMSGIDQQFIHYAHPVAFSLILIMIILLAKFSRRLSEFISKGIIPIICFLLLLSYTSVATTSLLLMRPLKFYDIDEVYTYLSPKLEYFNRRHLGYAIVALLSTIAIVICLPLLLLSEPYLNAKINFVKIKPLLDQFQGCYKDKYRSFAAYYMICRLVIIALFISNSSNDNFMIQYMLIATCVVTALIHLIVRPYTHVVLNVFDGAVLHIMILISVLPFVEHYESFGSELVLALAYILVILPLMIFIVMELLIHKEDIKKIIQYCKSFKLAKEKSNNNEIPLENVNREIGIIVDESMRKNATIVDVDRPEDRLPEIPWSRDSFIEVLNEIKD